jgi:hypothetical protein
MVNNNAEKEKLMNIKQQLVTQKNGMAMGNSNVLVIDSDEEEARPKAARIPTLPTTQKIVTFQLP